METNNSQSPVNLLLASASPRRRQMIRLLGMPFITAVVSDDEEEAQQRYRGPSEEMAEWLAKHKAAAALKLPQAAGRLVIAADTTVVLGNDVLGKPQNAEHALDLLRTLRGRWHHVISGVVVCSTIKGRTVMHSDSCITPVLMRNYSDAEILAYIATGDPMDKAGSYSIQHPTFQPTEQIDGCYMNVVGLPLCTVTDLLAEFGVYPERQHIRTDTPCPWSEKCQL